MKFLPYKEAIHWAWWGLIVGLLIIVGSPQLEAQLSPGTSSLSANGKITVFKGQELTFETNNGSVEIRLADTTVVVGEVSIKYSDITSGMYVGATAAKQPDGTFRASRLHIFPEDQRGILEGHRPLSSAPQSGLTMTNANVETVEDLAVQNIQGHMLTLKYKSGEIKVFVPPDTLVVKRAIGDRTLLKVGAEISVSATRDKDGLLSAARITVRATEK